MATMLWSYRDHTRPRGGGAVHGFHLVEQLRRHGHTLLTAERHTDGRLEIFPRTLSGQDRMLARADCIYMRCDARPFDLALLARNERGRALPVVLEINAPPEEAFVKGRGLRGRARVALRRSLYHAMARRADALICVSSCLADFVRQTFGVDATKVFVVPNGGTLASAPARGTPPGTGFRALWAGDERWPSQALDTVVVAAAILARRVPGAAVVIYADPHPRRLAGLPGVEIHRRVPHDAMAGILGRMDAALCLYRPLPYVPAGFYNSPLKLFEAMAAGLPVVGSRLGQIAEVIEDGVHGYLVADDPAEVAERLVRLAMCPAQRLAMGAAAHARSAARHTWDHTGHAVDAIVRSVLGRA
jgi:glycosyltransferase involved in cell wall biosynthesis